MYWHEKLERSALLLALLLAIYELVNSQYVSAFLMLMIWPTTRAAVCWVDVFYLFFTNKPLIRPARIAKDTEPKPTERSEGFQTFLSDELRLG